MLIQDFGEKIGGARKDLWKMRGLNEDDLLDMTDAERAKYVTRDHVWLLPDAKKQIEEGLPVFVAYWQREVRRQVRKIPYFYKDDNPNQIRKLYVRLVGKIRDAAMNVKKESDMGDFYEKMKHQFGVTLEEWAQCIDYDMQYIPYRHHRLKMRMMQNNFPNGKRKSPVKRKGRFVPPQLDHIEREGIDYRHGKHVDAKLWQDTFAFYGVQFGNWTNQKDRQYSMDYCFDALCDLADALEIDQRDIAFGHELSLAFGARGHSSASAHYETDRKVINLTKMHGAGNTAHEWFHGLDHQIALYYGVTDTILASNSKQHSILPNEFLTLMEAVKKDCMGNETDFLKGSKQFDRMYSKDHYGHWSSTSEMLARAFACYVKDVLGFKSDYLIAHADCYVFEYENQGYSAIPQGEEREILNELFDQLFFRLKTDGFLHPKKEVVEERRQSVIESAVYLTELASESTGQLYFCL